jgi:hypothetical protein
MCEDQTIRVQQWHLQRPVQSVLKDKRQDYERGLCTLEQEQGKDVQIYVNPVTVEQLIWLFLLLVKR